MNYQELLERLRRGNYYHAQIEEAADVIESLLAENKRLNAELAKYRDAPDVVWRTHPLCEWTTDKAVAEKWLSTPSQQAVPLMKRTIERCAVAADKAYATDEVIAAIRKLGEQ